MKLPSKKTIFRIIWTLIFMFFVFRMATENERAYNEIRFQEINSIYSAAYGVSLNIDIVLKNKSEISMSSLSPAITYLYSFAQKFIIMDLDYQADYKVDVRRYRVIDGLPNKLVEMRERRDDFGLLEDSDYYDLYEIQGIFNNLIDSLRKDGKIIRKVLNDEYVLEVFDTFLNAIEKFAPEENEVDLG